MKWKKKDKGVFKMNFKIGKFQAISLILIVMVNKILLNLPKEVIKQSKTGAPVTIIYVGIIAILIALLISFLFKNFLMKIL